MTFDEARKVIEEFTAQNPSISKEDVAKALVEKQQEWGMTDLDLGILLSGIGQEKYITQKAAQAMQQDGLMNANNNPEEGKEQPSQPSNEEQPSQPKPEEKTETETKDNSNDDEEKEKEEVRQMYKG